MVAENCTRDLFKKLIITICETGTVICYGEMSNKNDIDKKHYKLSNK